MLFTVSWSQSYFCQTKITKCDFHFLVSEYRTKGTEALFGTSSVCRVIAVIAAL